MKSSIKNDEIQREVCRLLLSEKFVDFIYPKIDKTYLDLGDMDQIDTYTGESENTEKYFSEVEGSLELFVTEFNGVQWEETRKNIAKNIRTT